VVKQIIDDVSNSDVMKGSVSVTLYDLNYSLCTVIYEKRNEEGVVVYRLSVPAGKTIWNDFTTIYKSSLSPVLKSAWQTIESQSGRLPFWNIEVIPAGRELKSKGYKDKDIAYITMKRDALTDFETKKIDGESFSYEIKNVDRYITAMYATTKITEKVFVLK
jgi:hypothetical protein